MNRTRASASDLNWRPVFFWCLGFPVLLLSVAALVVPISVFNEDGRVVDTRLLNLLGLGILAVLIGALVTGISIFLIHEACLTHRGIEKRRLPPTEKDQEQRDQITKIIHLTHVACYGAASITCGLVVTAVVLALL